MKKLIAISIATIMSLTPAQARADDSDQTSKKARVEFYLQMVTQGTAPTAYWDALAHCETRSNWQNKGTWSGGLGIYQRTWYEFGGYDYAKHPWQATRIEQIVIANRIAKFGYQWKNRYLTWADKVADKGMYKWRVGYFGWGCARETTGNPCGRLSDGSKGKYRPRRTWWRKNCA